MNTHTDYLQKLQDWMELRNYSEATVSAYNCAPVEYSLCEFHRAGLRSVFGMAGSGRLFGPIRAGRSAALFAEPLPQRQEVADGKRGLFGDAQVLRARPRASFGVSAAERSGT